MCNKFLRHVFFCVPNKSGRSSLYNASLIVERLPYQDNGVYHIIHRQSNLGQFGQKFDDASRIQELTVNKKGDICIIDYSGGKPVSGITAIQMGSGVQISHNGSTHHIRVLGGILNPVTQTPLDVFATFNLGTNLSWTDTSNGNKIILSDILPSSYNVIGQVIGMNVDGTLQFMLLDSPVDEQEFLMGLKLHLTDPSQVTVPFFVSSLTSDDLWRQVDAAYAQHPELERFREWGPTELDDPKYGFSSSAELGTRLRNLRSCSVGGQAISTQPTQIPQTISLGDLIVHESEPPIHVEPESLIKKVVALWYTVVKHIRSVTGAESHAVKTHSQRVYDPISVRPLLDVVSDLGRDLGQDSNSLKVRKAIAELAMNHSDELRQMVKSDKSKEILTTLNKLLLNHLINLELDQTDFERLTKILSIILTKSDLELLLELRKNLVSEQINVWPFQTHGQSDSPKLKAINHFMSEYIKSKITDLNDTLDNYNIKTSDIEQVCKDFLHYEELGLLDDYLEGGRLNNSHVMPDLKRNLSTILEFTVLTEDQLSLLCDVFFMCNSHENNIKLIHSYTEAQKCLGRPRDYDQETIEYSVKALGYFVNNYCEDYVKNQPLD